MTTTMSLIAKQTVGANGAASVTFNNIPQTYTDLKVVVSARSDDSDTGGDSFRIYFNNDTSATELELRSSGSGVASYSISYAQAGYITSNGMSSATSTFASGDIYIPNYTNSSNYKSASIEMTQEANATASYMVLGSRLWSSNSAITRIDMKPNVGSFTEFSTFYLYGISNSTTTQATTVPYAYGGDIVRTDGTYWYHTFLSSGTFTPLKELTCDYLVVAGGGGAGSQGGGGGGGGGAGGFRTSAGTSGGNSSAETALTLTSGNLYAFVVGAGGAAGAQGGINKGINGTDSSISGTGIANLISLGGGGGGGGGGNSAAEDGLSGGSGGGGGHYSSAGGAGTTGQGYAGGANAASYDAGGGGGGAASVGSNAGIGNTGKGGDGGSGLASSITGSSVTYAGGGGGGGYSGTSTVSGGGGRGGDSSSPFGTAATPNTGGGGGASYGVERRGTSGGSGIIVVRYAV